jgi:dihydrofolate synthase / folylpolyglutamate synthase
VATARALGIPAQEADSVEAALKNVHGAGAPGRVLICGSLHFAGVILRNNW